MSTTETKNTIQISDAGPSLKKINIEIPASAVGAKLKESMFAKDQPMMNLVRMLKTKMMERRTAKGFSGEVNDAVLGLHGKRAKRGDGRGGGLLDGEGARQDV